MQPVVPRMWDARELASFELPLVQADRSAQHAAPDYYYRLAVRPIYKSYPIYVPGREPDGYMDWLAQQEPEIAFDAVDAARPTRDWIAAGETVFEAPIGYGATFKLAARARPQLVRAQSDSGHQGRRHAVLALCHSQKGAGRGRQRVVRDVSRAGDARRHAAQRRAGQFPGRSDRRLQPSAAGGGDPKDPAALLDGVRLGQRTFFSMPWLTPDPIARVSIDVDRRDRERLRVRAGRRLDARQPQPVHARPDSRSDRREGAALPRSHRPGSAAHRSPT